MSVVTVLLSAIPRLFAPQRGRGPDKVSGFQGSALDTESDGRYTRARCVYFGFRFLLQEPP